MQILLCCPVPVGTAHTVPVTISSMVSTSGHLFGGVGGCDARSNVYQGILGLGPPGLANTGTTDWVAEARAPYDVGGGREHCPAAPVHLYLPARHGRPDECRRCLTFLEPVAPMRWASRCWAQTRAAALAGGGLSTW